MSEKRNTELNSMYVYSSADVKQLIEGAIDIHKEALKRTKSTIIEDALLDFILTGNNTIDQYLTLIYKGELDFFDLYKLIFSYFFTEVDFNKAYHNTYLFVETYKSHIFDYYTAVKSDISEGDIIYTEKSIDMFISCFKNNNDEDSKLWPLVNYPPLNFV